jgi:CheY-like chemotaxis protein
MIALTTRFKEVDQQKGLNSGFNFYLEKLQSDELVESINILLGAKQ